MQTNVFAQKSIRSPRPYTGFQNSSRRGVCLGSHRCVVGIVVQGRHGTRGTMLWMGSGTGTGALGSCLLSPRRKCGSSGHSRGRAGLPCACPSGPPCWGGEW